jgi:excisionase family DNA binding protein
VAEHLGVARESVYRWIDRRGLPAKRIGRHWRFRISEIDAWMLSGAAAISAEGRTGN